MTLDTPIALVTGGSRGIGRAICLRLARERHHVVVNYHLRADAAGEVCNQIEAAGGSAWPCQADVTSQEAVNALFEQIRLRYERLDLLVNNAGRAQEAPIAMTPADRFADIMEANFISAVRCSQAALKLMVRRRSGVIINVSSSSATRVPVGLCAYAASKAAMNALTVGMAREVAAYGIRVNAVAPSWTETDMLKDTPVELRAKRIERIPAGRIASPDEVAAVVSALARPEMSYVSGQVVGVDGGGIL